MLFGVFHLSAIMEFWDRIQHESCRSIIQFMRKFMTSQSVKSLSMFADEELCSFLPNAISSHVSMPVLADSVAIKLLNFASCSVSSFSCIENIVELLPPLREYVFPAESLDELEKFIASYTPVLLYLFFHHFISVLGLQVT